ncbi:hypothetical protein Pan44_30160 [Caulifigura coniformis]|uniref:VWFA domain-containing protein n=1 Tax=Caulifigura coniformis TaxID=2527983 RepID=A0A517SFR9_9PLAN|nr:vWA domain-containing protein [Caulifigura coniformis]QDT54975.1 hypothetical protein Pan44_30160 [Caulifigura coniformis]
MSLLPVLWRPWMPVLTIAGIAVVLGALAIYACGRSWRRVGARSLVVLAMRLAGVVALAVLLLGPSRERPVATSGERPKLTVLLDTSQSMTTADCGQQSRISHAVATVFDPQRLEILNRDCDVELEGFDTTVRPLKIGDVASRPDAFALGRETRLAEAVSTVVGRSQGDGHAILVLSDGRDTSGEPIQRAGSLAADRKIPIFTMPLGGPSSAPDAALMAMAMQDSLLPDETGNILVRIYQSGLTGRTGRVKLKLGEHVETFSVPFQQHDFAEIKIPIRQKTAGQYEYLVSLDPVGDEAELANNAQPVFVEVMNRRLRVLVIEGEPYWDTRFICQTLRKDEQIELVQLTQIGERKRETIVARAGAEISRLPLNAEEWSRYDVVMAGRGLERVLDDRTARGLAAYVEAGGQLVLARSRPYDATTDEGRAISRHLAPVEPVRWGDEWLPAARIQLAPSGRTGSWISVEKTRLDPDDAFRRLPPLEEIQRVASMPPASIVLAETLPADGGEPQPAIVRMQVGRGATVAILGEGSWKWSLLTPNNHDLRGFYDIFWSNLVRWLAFGGDFPPGQQASLQLSRRSVRLGDDLTIDVAYRFAPDGAAAPSLELTSPGGETRPLVAKRLPGPLPRYRATLQTDAAGVHHVTASTPGLTPAEMTARFNVYDVNRERLNASADPLTLKMLSDLSGGAVTEPESFEELGNQLASHRRSMETPPQIEFIWDQAFVMWTLLGWMAAEWLIRRLLGLW